MDLEQMQAIAFQIIAQVGTAKSMYLESLQLVKKNEYAEADKLFAEAEEVYAEGHKLHFDIVTAEAKGEKQTFSVLFMHAEDQLLSCETIKILCEELIIIYKQRINQ